MSETTCPQCGARYASKSDSCTARWHELLALDHSRLPPWGPLHGLAFATYTLQHCEGTPVASLARCWESLTRIVVQHESPAVVFDDLRARGASGDAPVPGLEHATAPHTFATTIADLGSFSAASYEAELHAWAGATVDAWQRVLHSP